MSKENKVDCGRRRLIVATAAVGGAGAVAALAEETGTCAVPAWGMPVQETTISGMMSTARITRGHTN
jgi:hypothetical protein